MAIKVYYHSGDLDGFCSGAIVKHTFPNAEMYPINYGDEFPFDDIGINDIVYMVDFSLPTLDMQEVNGRCDLNLIWIDHHIGAIRDYEQNGLYTLLGLRESGVAACELTWKYFYINKEVPIFIRLLSLYDVWNHDDKEFDWDFIEQFQYGFKAGSRDPRDDIQFWENWFNTVNWGENGQIRSVETTSGSGKLIQSYVEDRFKSTLKDRSYKVDWEGYKCLVVNSDPYIANFMTRSKEFEGCDIAINYANRKGKSWEVSLRAVRDNIDLSELAKKYGGNGHKKAAGFNWIPRILPWEMEVN
jgi:oligoribonuclease NrnB/cAMP/cGMP phosphodiesterase (DHH superfamily)